MRNAWCKIEVTTIGKCFAAARFSSNISDSTGEEDEDLFADFDRAFQDLIIKSHTPGCIWKQRYLHHKCT
jgi:hypothetical protein